MLAAHSRYRTEEIHDGTYVWNKTMPEWLPLTAEPELMALLKAAAAGGSSPPPPPRPGQKSSAPAPTRPAARSADPAGSAADGKRPTAFSGQSLLRRAGAADKWLQKKTLDGAPWYHNEGTGEVSWDMPPALWGNDRKMRDDGNWVWVPDAKMGFVTGERVSGTPEEGMAVKLENGMRMEVPPGSKVFPLARSALIRLEQDLVMLDALDEGMICHTLRSRFAQDAFYTSVGHTNPNPDP